jgi:VanZ family protein
VRARAVLAATVLLQLLVLYWPRTPGTGGLPVDKVVHAVVFGAVLWAGVRCGIRVLPLTAVLLLHAVLSELIQATLLPNRSGDPADVLADGLGVLIALVIVQRPRAISRAG